MLDGGKTYLEVGIVKRLERMRVERENREKSRSKMGRGSFLSPETEFFYDVS